MIGETHHVTAEHIRKLIESLEKKYPANIWAKAFPDGPPVDDWVLELKGIDVEAVRHALIHLRESHALYPPTAMQFANLCQSFYAGHNVELSPCRGIGCPLTTSGKYCRWHFFRQTDMESSELSERIKRNAAMVRYLNFIDTVSLGEILNPRDGFGDRMFYKWPAEMLAAWDSLPPYENEKPGQYKARVAQVVTALVKPKFNKPEPNDDYGQPPLADEGLKPMGGFQPMPGSN